MRIASNLVSVPNGPVQFNPGVWTELDPPVRGYGLDWTEIIGLVRGGGLKGPVRSGGWIGQALQTIGPVHFKINHVIDPNQAVFRYLHTQMHENRHVPGLIISIQSGLVHSVQSGPSPGGGLN